MAREVKLYFGGAERALYLDARDAIEIKRKLGKKPRRVLDEDIAAEIVDASGKGIGRISAYEVDVHSLVTVLQLAISHVPGTNRRDETITYDVVLDWLTEYLETQSILTIVHAVTDELHVSGVMGLAIDFDAVRKRIEDQQARDATPPEPAPSDDAGKA